jgi:hypothetical protein
MKFPCVKIDKGSGREGADYGKAEKLTASVMYKCVESNDMVLFDVLLKRGSARSPPA